LACVILGCFEKFLDDPYYVVHDNKKGFVFFIFITLWHTVGVPVVSSILTLDLTQQAAHSTNGITSTMTYSNQRYGRSLAIEINHSKNGPYKIQTVTNN